MQSSVFANCTALTGRLTFPNITGISASTSAVEPFVGCTGGITEFAFAKANEEAIKASTGYQTDPTLGTGTAVCTFNL